MPAHWIVERTRSPRFPFRITIVQDGRVLLAVRAQGAWPGAGTQVFCLREREFDPGEALEEVDRVPVARLARVGRKLVVALDRPQRKRCEFLKVEKTVGGRAPPVEQIFFRTETAARAHRTSGRVELVPQRDLEVAVDLRERYPWRFPGSTVVRRTLPVGDYALVRDERLVAVAERKSLANFLADVHEIRGLHQQLAELGGYAHAALLVEAQYGDLGKPDRIGRWPAAHLLRVVGELAALHPRVPVVFAGNRKLANAWVQRWFAAVAAADDEPVTALVREPVRRWEGGDSQGGLDAEIRAAAAVGLPDGFRVDDLRWRFPQAGDDRLRRVLHALRREGRLRCSGRGRTARWLRTPHKAPGDPAAAAPAPSTRPSR